MFVKIILERKYLSIHGRESLKNIFNCKNSTELKNVINRYIDSDWKCTLVEFVEE